MKTTNKTPMMQQYLSIKERHPNEILFFRMGDFYEMFLDDAVYASGVLDIALTQRGDGVPMCGIPYHAWQNYILKILKSGRNIAICEQMEDPKSVKNRIVRRDVIRILTPGSIFEEELVDKAGSSLLASIFPSDEETLSLAMADLSTGELWLDVIQRTECEGYLKTRDVSEVLVTKEIKQSILRDVRSQTREYHFTNHVCQEKLKKAFNIDQLNLLEFSLTETTNLYRLFSYVEEIAPQLRLKWQKPLKCYLQKSMRLDEVALETLEILKDQEGREGAALIAVLDKTKTRAGRRLLRQMLIAPSFDRAEIEERHHLVGFLIEKKDLREKLQGLLKQVKDSARILNHLRHAPRVSHLGELRQTLMIFQELRQLLKSDQGELPEKLPERLASFWLNSDFPQGALGLLQKTLVKDALPPLLDERRFVKEGFSHELDELFELSGSARLLVSDFEKKEQKRWGISTLKVRYNRMIGYHIEISKGMAHLAPEHYLRRQTLTNAERFTLGELSELENRILNAKDHITEKQKKIFDELLGELLKEEGLILAWANEASFLDCIASFAEVAVQNKYIRPTLRDDGDLILKDSRHPVVEAVHREEVFVPNDVHLDQNKRHLAILTGPNMSGKSTYIRQIGLIQIMAQVGSFVPASYAEVSLVDRIFTRIGAYDRLFKGESTFFVEMSECARIFQNYTSQSLILLDEVGRGTSTFDGVSIARAMLEFFNQDEERRAKTLFATHFTELSELINTEKGIFGLTVQVMEEGGHITFLRKIREGVTSKSYGIHVARLAGVPHEVVVRAGVLMQSLEKNILWTSKQKKSKNLPEKKKDAKKGAGKEQPVMF